MARSYKKHHWCKDGNSRKKSKKQLANRKIRRNRQILWELPNGRKFRQITNPWDICDYRSYATFRSTVEAHQNWYSSCVARYGKAFADRVVTKDWKILYRDWARTYLRK